MIRTWKLLPLPLLCYGLIVNVGCNPPPIKKPVAVDLKKAPEKNDDHDHHEGDSYELSHKQPGEQVNSASGNDLKIPEARTQETQVAEIKSPTEVKTDSPPAVTAAPDNAAETTTEKVLLGIPELTAGIPGEGPLTKEQIKAWLDNPMNHVVIEPILPLGLHTGAGQEKGLKENPLTRAKIELGRQLYFDTRLSADSTVSCASCHSPDSGYAKNEPFGVGIKQQKGGRNSPTAYNRILSDVQFWDGRAASLEEQAKGPIQNPIEMGNSHEVCVSTVTSIPPYKMQFEKVFGGVATIDNIAKAIASFERAVVTGPAPFDYNELLRAFAGQDEEEIKEDPGLWAKYQEAKAALAKTPMSESALRGRELFFGQKANCTACHVGPNLTDEKFHNLGVGMMAAKPDLGRSEISKDEKDTGAFKTPTIRNVALTGPYMHDGSQQTLEEVVEWYAKGGHPNPHLSDKVKKLDLTAQEKTDLVEFMKACTGSFPLVETGRLPVEPAKS